MQTARKVDTFDTVACVSRRLPNIDRLPVPLSLRMTKSLAEQCQGWANRAVEYGVRTCDLVGASRPPVTQFLGDFEMKIAYVFAAVLCLAGMNSADAGLFFGHHNRGCNTCGTVEPTCGAPSCAAPVGCAPSCAAPVECAPAAPVCEPACGAPVCEPAPSCCGRVKKVRCKKVRCKKVRRSCCGHNHGCGAPAATCAAPMAAPACAAPAYVAPTCAVPAAACCN